MGTRKNDATDAAAPEADAQDRGLGEFGGKLLSAASKLPPGAIGPVVRIFEAGAGGNAVEAARAFSDLLAVFGAAHTKAGA